MEMVIGLVGGAFLSWPSTDIYYRKASAEIPDWARPLVARLPLEPPTTEELIELYHQAVLKGDIVPHPSDFVKCPECGAGAEQFVPWDTTPLI